MKKGSLLFSCFLLLLSSCFSNKQEDLGHTTYNDGSYSECILWTLDDPTYEDTGSEVALYHRLSTEELNESRNKKATFLLFVYAPGCSSCDLVTSQISNYIKTHKVLINYMILENYLASDSSVPLEENSLLAYHDGVLEHAFDLAKSPDSFAKILSKFQTYSLRLYNPCSVRTYPVSHLPYYEIRLTLQIETNAFYSFNRIQKEEWYGKRVLLVKTSFEDYRFLDSLQKEELSGVLFYDEKDPSFELTTGLDVDNLKTYTFLSYSKEGNESHTTTDTL